MNRTPIALFNHSSAATALQRRLRENGLAAEIHDDAGLGKFWFVWHGRVGARLEVPADQFEGADQLLLDWDASEGALRNAIRCPECRSLRVDYPQFTRRSFIPNLVVGLLAALGRVEKEYYCQDCQFTWPKEGEKHSPARPHSAPYYFIEGIEQTALRDRKRAAA